MKVNIINTVNDSMFIEEHISCNYIFEAKTIDGSWVRMATIDEKDIPYDYSTFKNCVEGALEYLRKFSPHFYNLPYNKDEWEVNVIEVKKG